MKKFLKEWASVIIVLVIMILLRTFVFTTVTVSGHSMDPTLQDREFIFALKNTDIKRGDIVTFPAPDNDKDKYIKRVIGLPGDTVHFKDDQLYVNGQLVTEPYLDAYKKNYPVDRNFTEPNPADGIHGDFSLQTLFQMEKVPADSLFVLGDNRPRSKDSRMLGFIKKDEVIGNTKICLWPPSKMGKIQ